MAISIIGAPVFIWSMAITGDAGVARDFTGNARTKGAI
jgi:hypothetical protein